MQAFGKVLCQGGDRSDKWPLNRVYDGIPQALAERQTSVSLDSFALSSLLRCWLFGSLPIRSILLTLAGTLNSFRRKFPRSLREPSRVGPETSFCWIFKPPRGKSAKESRASAHPSVTGISP